MNYLKENTFVNSTICNLLWGADGEVFNITQYRMHLYSFSQINYNFSKQLSNIIVEMQNDIDMLCCFITAEGGKVFPDNKNIDLKKISAQKRANEILLELKSLKEKSIINFKIALNKTHNKALQIILQKTIYDYKNHLNIINIFSENFN